MFRKIFIKFMEWMDSYYSRDYLKQIEILKSENIKLDKGTDILKADLVEITTERDKFKESFGNCVLEESEVQEPGWLINHMLYKPKRRFVSKTKDVTIKFEKPQYCFDKSTMLYDLLKKNNLLKVEKTYYNMKKVMRLITGMLTYENDKSDNWRPISDVLMFKYGDCFAEYEEIYTSAGLIKIKDVKIGDTILSYDFNKKEFVGKTIINKIDKGILPLKRVHLRNGQHIDVTKDHPFWCKTNERNKLKNGDNIDSIYEKRMLSNIDLSIKHQRKIPTIIKLPYINKDIDWLTEDLCFVIGHYLAEGWKEKNDNRVSTSGYDIIEYIIPILEKYNIPFYERTNSNGCPIVRLNKNKFTTFLGTLKENSFDIHLSEDILCLPENKLQKILDGYFLGDGHSFKKCKTHGNAEYCYSTSSEQFADDICRIHLQLGKPVYKYKQINHQGLGNEPIYRIQHNPESYFNRDYGYNGLSETSIFYIEDLDISQVYDLTVENTSTVIMKNGLLMHQCDDLGGIAITSALGMAGWKADEVFAWCGWYYPKGKSIEPNNKFCHAWCIAKCDSKWYVLEGTNSRADQGFGKIGKINMLVL